MDLRMGSFGTPRGSINNHMNFSKISCIDNFYSLTFGRSFKDSVCSFTGGCCKLHGKH